MREASVGERLDQYQLTDVLARSGMASIFKAIDSAKESVYAQNYSFNSEPVARALARANKRCHKVIVILDQSQLTAKNTMLPLIGKAGIETYVDKQHAIATSRSMVIDGHIVISGSFSLATSEDFTSADSTLIVDSRESAKQHYDNFMAHKSHCVRYNY